MSQNQENEESRLIRHFNALGNSVQDMQSDIQAILTLVGRLRLEKDQLSKALDEAIKLQGTDRKMTRGELLDAKKAGENPVTPDDASKRDSGTPKGIKK